MNVRRSFEEPDEVIEVGGVTQQLISIGGLTIARSVQPPGWRWSKDLQPLVGGERCHAHHVGIVLSGRQAVELADGTRVEFGPGDLYDIPPGHDGSTVGDEPCVVLEWSGMRAWLGGTPRHRVLATLLFTDLVASTETAARLGDAAWHDLLSVHYQACRAEIERFAGRDVSTTGDGLFAMFEAAAQAVRCAIAIRDLSVRQGVQVRVGVHVGEVELSGDDVRGLAVHEAARIMSAAGPSEVWVSETAALFARTADLTFEDVGEHELKGVPEPRRLYRLGD